MKGTLVSVAAGVLWAGSALAPAPLAAASEYQVAKWEAGPAALPGARYGFGTVHIPALLNSTSRGHVMVAGGHDGEKELDSVYLYSVDAATWRASTAMPVATYSLGMTYIPAQDDSTKGHVMLVGGHDVEGKVFDSVYFSAPVTTTTATTATTIAITTTTTTFTVTTTSATTTAAASTTTTSISAATTTTIASTTSPTTAWLGVNASCDPLADACDSSTNLACAADVYECRYITTTMKSTTTTVAAFDSPAKTTGGSNATVVVVVVLVVLLVLTTACWWFAVGRHRNSRQGNNGDFGGPGDVAIEMTNNPMPVAAAARSASNPMYQPAGGPPNNSSA